MLKSCNSFRQSWTWHRLFRPSGVNRKMPRRQVEPGAGMIEVEIDGVTVRVGCGADAKTVTAVLRALKDGR